MQVYVVWNQRHDEEDYDCNGADITGVYTNELTAYKTACVKQVHEHLYYYDVWGKIEDEDDTMKEWLYENPFPDAEETDVNVWKKYFDIVSDDKFVYKIKQDKKDKTRPIPPYEQYQVTEEDLCVE